MVSVFFAEMESENRVKISSNAASANSRLRAVRIINDKSSAKPDQGNSVFVNTARVVRRDLGTAAACIWYVYSKKLKSVVSSMKSLKQKSNIRRNNGGPSGPPCLVPECVWNFEPGPAFS